MEIAIKTRLARLQNNRTYMDSEVAQDELRSLLTQLDSHRQIVCEQAAELDAHSRRIEQLRHSENSGYA